MTKRLFLLTIALLVSGVAGFCTAEHVRDNPPTSDVVEWTFDGGIVLPPEYASHESSLNDAWAWTGFSFLGGVVSSGLTILSFVVGRMLHIFRRRGG
jgi:hypothetical protein